MTRPPASDSHQQDLGRGFNWLGGATIIAKIIDFSTILLVLVFLTKQQIGVAALVVSIGMVVESLDGLGTSEALVQAKSVSALQLDSLFWFILGSAGIVGGAVVLASPAIQAVYGIAGLAGFFWAVAAKQPLVGIALIPLAMMNRNLQYERIAIVNTGATLAAALTRLGLAALGAGAWALVLGYAASGFFVLVGALLARPFRPAWRFDFSSIRPLLSFGMRSAASNMFQQMFKNVDYLLVGWFYGAAPLAVYRVAFDVAMEPALAVGTLVNRTALPVFARVAAVRPHLAQAFTWSLQRLLVLVAPLTVGLIFLANPLMGLLHDKQGASYAAAALPLKILAVAALLRVVLELLMPVMMGSGQPGLAARLSGLTLVLLSIGIFAAGVSFHANAGIVAVSAVWLGVYPLLLVRAALYLRRHWGIGIAAMARSVWQPMLGVLGLVCCLGLVRLLAHGGPTLQIGIVVAATALTYAGLLFRTRRQAVPL